MKKKILLCAVLLSGVLSAEAVSENSNSENRVPNNRSFVFFGGVGLTESFARSTFEMSYDADQDSYPSLNSYAKRKKSCSGKLGGEIFVGVKSNNKQGWFWGTELSYSLNRFNYNKDLSYDEDQEEFPLTEYKDCKVSNIKVKYGNELGMYFKLGRSFNSWDIYGIFGGTTRKVNLNYSVYAVPSTDHNRLETNFSSRIYGVALGMGVNKSVTDRVDCSLEYKYKIYGNADKNVDLINESAKGFGVDHDASARNFKIKTNVHELALKVSVNI